MHSEVRAISTRLGPVFTGAGVTGWDLLLLDDRIEAYRFGGWRSLAIQLLLYFGCSIDKLLGRWRAAWTEGVAPTAVTSDRRLYPIAALEAVTVKRCAGPNELRLSRREGSTDIFGILQRERTDEFRAALQFKYPALYREEGF